ncbi:MAG: glycosyltransferase family 4 protein [Gemmatimonadota bacterium]
MSGLRICMLTTFYPPFNFGGDGIAVQRLSHALVAAGHQVTVIHDTNAFNALQPAAPLHLPLEDRDGDVRIVRLHSRLGALAPLLVQQCGAPVSHRRQLQRLLAPGEWDVVNFHNVSLLGAPALLDYPRDAVTLYMAHEHWLVCPTHVLWRHRRERCDERQCLRCVLRHHRPPQLWRHTGALQRAVARLDAVIAMSEFSRQKHHAFGLAREMDVLPPFLPREAAPVAAPGGSPHPRPYFFFAGRLERMKGLDDVLEAFRGFDAADLVIAGDGSQRERWQAMAAGMDHVHFLGTIPSAAVERWQQYALAALVPSVGYETFGMVIIEAFRVGTPVIARRIGPFPEIVATAGAGELFDGATDLRVALQRLATDTAYRTSLSTAAMASRERWSAAVVIPKYLEIVARAGRARGHQRVTDLLRQVA